MSDPAAFQEIDDAVRQDDLKMWWKRYGTWVIAGAVGVVVAVAAMVGWRQYDAAQRAMASEAYSAALAKVGKDDAAAKSALDQQAVNAPEPYRTLAALAAAQLVGSSDQDVAALTAAAQKLPSELGDLALVIAAFRGADSSKADELVARLQPLNAPDRAYRLSVRELQALAAARKGDLKQAREAWQEIARDRSLPGAQQRAQAMLNFYGPAEAKQEAK